jgi:hypothetical protein
LVVAAEEEVVAAAVVAAAAVVVVVVEEAVVRAPFYVPQKQTICPSTGSQRSHVPSGHFLPPSAI